MNEVDKSDFSNIFVENNKKEYTVTNRKSTKSSFDDSANKKNSRKHKSSDFFLGEGKSEQKKV